MTEYIRVGNKHGNGQGNVEADNEAIGTGIEKDEIKSCLVCILVWDCSLFCSLLLDQS